MAFLRRNNVATTSTTAATNKTLRTLLCLSNLLKWISSVIVLGVVSYYIDKYTTGQHLIYEEVIAALSTAFYIPGLFLAFHSAFTWHLLPLDAVFSYLWLTAFIFTAQDYNWRQCSTRAPAGASDCALKFTSEAFSFLAFFFTLTSALLYTLIWVDERRVVAAPDRVGEKHVRPSGETAATADTAV